MLHSPSTSPERATVLIVFADLTGYTKITQSMDCLSNFQFISEFSARVGQIVAESGGVVIKFIGDAALLVWPEDAADGGVQALFHLKESLEQWLASQGHASRLVVKAHLGEVAWGLLGAPGDLRPDVIGEAVNTAALLPSHGIAVTPQVFRSLSPETRRLFKKHTPPVTYIPVGERHRDR